MNHDNLVEAIANGTAALGQALPCAAADKLAILLEELARWGERTNLTAIRKFPDMVSGHILDSLSVRPHLHGHTILDVGTGAGFPGLPLAIAEPARQFVLLDSNAKKLAFVRHIIGKLGLSNVCAVKVRAEDYAPGKRFDTVTARALASMPRLIELSGHLLGEKGVFLALKGKHPAGELDDLPQNWEYNVIELEIPGLEQRSRHLIVLGSKENVVA